MMKPQNKWKKRKLRQKILKIIDERDPPYLDQTQLVLDKYKNKAYTATCAMMVLEEHTSDGYIVTHSGLKLTEKGRLHLNNLKEIKKIDRRAWIAIAVSILSVAVAIFK